MDTHWEQVLHHLAQRRARSDDRWVPDNTVAGSVIVVDAHPVSAAVIFIVSASPRRGIHTITDFGLRRRA